MIKVTGYTLSSTPMINSVGLVRYFRAIAVYDPRKAKHLMKVTFEGLPKKAIDMALNGDYTTEGETVIINLPDGEN